MIRDALMGGSPCSGKASGIAVAGTPQGISLMMDLSGSPCMLVCLPAVVSVRLASSISLLHMCRSLATER
jgi:hypothetical protein